MKVRRRLATVSLATLAVAGAGVFAAVSASASTPPPWQNGQGGTGHQTPDPNNVGTLTFYDSGGHVITTGSTLSPDLGAYIEATGLTPLAGNNKATLYAYTPSAGSNPGAWSGQALSGATAYPNASAPAPLSTDAKPVVTVNAADDTLDDYSTNAFPNTDTTSGYVGVYELRVRTSGTGGPDVHYASADVVVDGSNHTWTQVYPTGSATTGNTTVSLDPLTTPSTAGVPVTLTATVTPHGTPGSVTFSDNGSALGGPVAVSTSTDRATLTLTPAVGTHSFTAAFAPSSGSLSGSTSGAVPLTVNKANPIVEATATPGSVPYGTAETVHVTVAAPGVSPTGSVSLTEGTIGLGTAPLSGGAATFVLPRGLSAGAVTITAAYPGDANLNAASGTATFTITKAAVSLGVKLNRSKIPHTAHGKVAITASGSGFTPTGSVQIFVGKKRIASGALRNGKATLVLPKLAKGRYHLVVRYLGGADTLAGNSRPVTLRVS
jgi:hypothetical protein